MCSHYQALKERERYLRHFGVEPPLEPGKLDLWPGYMGAFIRRHPHADVCDDAVPESEALSGLFGLVPHWATDTKITRSTYNARSETVAEKPSFRDAWKRGQHCIIPADLNRTNPAFGQARSEIARRLQAGRQVHHLDAEGQLAHTNGAHPIKPKRQTYVWHKPNYFYRASAGCVT